MKDNIALAILLSCQLLLIGYGACSSGPPSLLRYLCVEDHLQRHNIGSRERVRRQLWHVQHRLKSDTTTGGRPEKTLLILHRCLDSTGSLHISRICL